MCTKQNTYVYFIPVISSFSYENKLNLSTTLKARPSYFEVIQVAAKRHTVTAFMLLSPLRIQSIRSYW